MDRWMDRRKISPFYRTLSPIGAAAPLQPNFNQKTVQSGARVPLTIWCLLATGFYLAVKISIPTASHAIQIILKRKLRSNSLSISFCMSQFNCAMVTHNWGDLTPTLWTEYLNKVCWAWSLFLLHNFVLCSNSLFSFLEGSNHYYIIYANELFILYHKTSKTTNYMVWVLTDLVRGLTQLKIVPGMIGRDSDPYVLLSIGKIPLLLQK